MYEVSYIVIHSQFLYTLLYPVKTVATFHLRTWEIRDIVKIPKSYLNQEKKMNGLTRKLIHHGIYVIFNINLLYYTY